MKLYKVFMGLTAAAMFAACSSDDIIAENPYAGGFDAEGNGYLKIGINLPSIASASRGIGDYATSDPGEYGEYNDGAAYEYTVENAILCVFSKAAGAGEMDATLIGAYQLGSGAWNNNTSAEITTDRKFIQQISNAGADGDLYAYVILNKHDFFEVSNGELTFRSAPSAAPEVLNGKPFSHFGSLVIQEQGRRYDTNSFMMTNMPYASEKGGTVEPSDAVEMYTLYPINSDAVYPSQAAAELGTAAAEVNVERVLAKVQADFTYPVGKDYFETEAKDASNNPYKVKILGWFIDNTNPNTYVGRHYTDPNTGDLSYLRYASEHMTTPTWRFISRNNVTDGAYRTFWAIDPNYDKKAGDGCDALVTKQGQVVNPTLMSFNPVTGVNEGGDLRPHGSYYYCTENTFDVAHQSEFNTTRVVVAGQIGEEDPITHEYPCFFTIEQEANKTYNLDAIKEYTKARIADRVIFKQWVADFCNSSVLDATTFIDVKVSTEEPALHKAGPATVSVSVNPKDFEPSMVRSDKNYADAVDAYKRMVNGDDTPGQIVTGHNKYLAENFTINHYEGGIAYYHVLIKHFGDDETPWSKDAHAGVTNDITGVYTQGGAYPNGSTDSSAKAEKNYLGRYGVVRNNWYFINIEGVRQIGSPVVPVLPGTDPDTPDDQVESYLKVKINITPWAIRKQNAIL